MLPVTLNAHGGGVDGEHVFVITLSAVTLGVTTVILTMSLVAAFHSCTGSEGRSAHRACRGRRAVR